MNIIFLDIDGVLNNDYTTECAPSGCTGVDDELVEKLGKIVKRTNAAIVLSSSWREGWERDYDSCDSDVLYLIGKLSKINAVIIDKIGGDPYGTDRGRQIIDYLEKRDFIDNFIILDDMVFADYHVKPLFKHFVQTDYKSGLSENDIVKSIAILNSTEKGGVN